MLYLRSLPHQKVFELIFDYVQIKLEVPRDCIEGIDFNPMEERYYVKLRDRKISGHNHALELDDTKSEFMDFVKENHQKYVPKSWESPYWQMRPY